MGRYFLVLILLLLPVTGCALLPEAADETEARRQDPSELYDRALRYYDAGNYSRARDLFHVYIGQNPQSLLLKPAIYYLAHATQMLGDTKEALVLYNRVVHDYGDDDFWGDRAMARIREIKDTASP